MIKNLSLVVCAVGLSVVLVGCKPKCDSTSCATGCCDATGTCQAGTLATACGTAGATCQPCGAGTTCNLGTCTFGGIGGGTGGGTGGGMGGGTGGGTGGGLGGGTGGGGGTVQFCTEYADAFIARYLRCGVITSALATEYRTLLVSQCAGGASFLAGVKDGRVVVNMAAYQACLSGFANGSCATDPTCDSEAAFDGTVGLMGDCFNDIECQDAFWCDTTMTCPGTCAQRIALGQSPGNATCVKAGYPYNSLCTAYVANGQSCAPMGGSSSQQQCVVPNVCSPADQCGPVPTRSSVNGPCMSESNCALGLQCVSNVCIALGTLNAACDSMRRCQQGLTCGMANTCIDASPQPIGNTCGNNIPCVSDAFCNIQMGMMTGTCAARRVENGTCTYNGNECATGLVCSANFMMMTGVCRQPGALNAACTYPGFNACRSGLYCTATFQMMSGVCANQKGSGATCMDSQECLSFQCDSNSNTCTRPSCFDPTP